MANVHQDYSGHGGQIRDPDGDRASGFDDTIVPVDFEQNGQLDSDTLHRHLVTRLHPTSTLFVVFDCCHSGSAIELPFVYRSDEDGNVSLMDNVKQGLHLVQTAQTLLQGGFSMNKVQDAKQLLAGATSFFQGLKHRAEPREEGLGEEHFQEDWRSEQKRVFMYSGCKDDQTSADASISGEHVGAMSWAFLQNMKANPNQSYLQVRTDPFLALFVAVGRGDGFGTECLADCPGDAGPPEYAPAPQGPLRASPTALGRLRGGLEPNAHDLDRVIASDVHHRVFPDAACTWSAKGASGNQTGLSWNTSHSLKVAVAHAQ